MSYYSTTYTPANYGNVLMSVSGVAGNGASTSASNLIWNGGTSTATWTTANPVTITQQAKIELKGEGADVVINGESLNQTLKEIKEVLRIPSKLNQDHKLEKEWAELQEAADHYNKLLEEYREKQKVWDTLKTQD